VNWPMVSLGDVAEIQGGIQKQPKRSPQRNAFPFLRVANVTAQGLNLEEIHAIELFDGELERYRLRRGDLLVVEGNGSASQIGRAAVWDGSIKDAVHQNHLIRVRPGCLLNERFLGLFWNSPSNRAELARIASSTSGLHTLSVAKLKRIMLPLPPPNQQRRIVEVLEDHLSRIEAGDRWLSVGPQKLEALWLAALSESRRALVGARTRTIGDIAETALGKMLDAKKQLGRPTPYLRNINVRWREFDLSDVQLTPLTESEVQRFDVRPGDVMACEGGEPGRCAVWRRPVGEVAFQKALHRIRVRNPGEVLPSFLALMLEEAIRSGRCNRMFTGTTIKHLPQEKLRVIEIPVPSSDTQLRAVGRLTELIEAQVRLRTAIANGAARSAAMRSSLLTAAFSGGLTAVKSSLPAGEELTHEP
jgi:type I restriction enzyme S subunit